jgi:cytochrome c2
VHSLSTTTSLVITFVEHSAKKVDVTFPSDGDGAFAECQACKHSAKEAPVGPHASLFAVCNTQQSAQRSTFLFVFVIPSKQTKNIYH